VLVAGIGTITSDAAGATTATRQAGAIWLPMRSAR
jgi:hypothetical protein